MKIAVLGPEGTFSEVASENYLKINSLEGELIYFSSIEESVKIPLKLNISITIINIGKRKRRTEVYCLPFPYSKKLSNIGYNNTILNEE